MIPIAFTWTPVRQDPETVVQSLPFSGLDKVYSGLRQEGRCM